MFRRGGELYKKYPPCGNKELNRKQDEMMDKSGISFVYYLKERRKLLSFLWMIWKTL